MIQLIGRFSCIIKFIKKNIDLKLIMCEMDVMDEHKWWLT